MPKETSFAVRDLSRGVVKAIRASIKDKAREHF